MARWFASVPHRNRRIRAAGLLEVLSPDPVSGLSRNQRLGLERRAAVDATLAAPNAPDAMAASLRNVCNPVKCRPADSRNSAGLEQWAARRRPPG